MQIASTPQLPVAASFAAGLPDANRVLATARVRFRDLDDNVTFTSHLQLVSGGRLGALDGYATLRDAVFELGVLTRGERIGAAAVIERAGRFYGHVLKGRDLEEGVRAPLRRTYLEPDARAAVVTMRVTGGFERLRALVDGGWSRRIRT